MFASIWCAVDPNSLTWQSLTGHRHFADMQRSYSGLKLSSAGLEDKRKYHAILKQKLLPDDKME